MITAGDVIYIYDGTITPPDMKYLVCIVVSESLYFRINSKGHWTGSMSISGDAYSFLRHDSYIECGSILEFDDDFVEQEMSERKNPVGYLSDEDMRRLIKHIETVVQLSPRDKKKIISSLGAIINDE